MTIASTCLTTMKTLKENRAIDGWSTIPRDGFNIYSATCDTSLWFVVCRLLGIPEDLAKGVAELF